MPGSSPTKTMSTSSANMLKSAPSGLPPPNVSNMSTVGVSTIPRTSSTFSRDIRATKYAPLGTEPLSQVLERQRVAVLDRPVLGVEQLEEDVGNADVGERAAEGF